MDDQLFTWSQGLGACVGGCVTGSVDGTAVDGVWVAGAVDCVVEAVVLRVVERVVEAVVVRVVVRVEVRRLVLELALAVEAVDSLISPFSSYWTEMSSSVVVSVADALLETLRSKAVVFTFAVVASVSFERPVKWEMRTPPTTQSTSRSTTAAPSPWDHVNN